MMFKITENLKHGKMNSCFPMYPLNQFEFLEVVLCIEFITISANVFKNLESMLSRNYFNLFEFRYQQMFNHQSILPSRPQS
ncbi:hypothetical protein DKG77_01190 [Flagellimonas aquimarina]|uniref:Uncharacterized protein n=1 Tax=Flagellimonas aquimarina TaxID=2201895 RepID=A0A316KZ39_9FLAO|nr:hypothetical protein DKG77_01190 [Allomuricauda koreensis]